RSPRHQSWPRLPNGISHGSGSPPHQAHPSRPRGVHVDAPRIAPGPRIGPSSHGRMPHMGPVLQIPGASHLHSGKVRDLYDLGDGRLLMVATDRISAFDHVLATRIPDKGKILTRMSTWWFELLADVAPNHLISTDVPDEVAGRAVVCERLDMFPIECVARGYLAGSAVRDYTATG